MALQNFVDKQGVVSAAWLNAVDALLDTVFGSTATKVAARAALTSDLPMEVANGGTGVRTLAALASALNSYFSIGGPQTAAEILAGVTPTNTLYSVGDVRRYGAVKDGSTPCAAAFQQAALVAAAGGNYGKIFVPADTPSNSPNATYGYCYLMTGGSGTNTLVLPAGCTLYGEGAGSRLKWTTDFINGIVTANDVTVDGIAVEGPQSNDNGPSYSYLLTNGIYGYQKRNVTIRNCIVSKWHFAGIHLNSCANYRIEGNVLHSQVRPVFGSSDNSTSDIVVYGTALPAWGYIGKGLIHGNFCYSDNNVGIHVDPLGYDSEIVVSDNIIVPLDTIYSANNWTELATASAWRRYGIVVSYQASQNSGGKIVVEGNFVKNCCASGIIRESAASNPQSPCMVVGNYVTKCGYSGGRTYPQTGVASSFGFGIFFNGSNSAGDAVVGNVVTYTQALGDTSRGGANLTFQSGGIVVDAVAKANAGNMMISGNTSCYNSTHGIAIMFSATQSKVIGNYLHSNNDADLTMYVTDAAAGDVIIESNTCVRVDGTLANPAPCIALWGNVAGSGRITVRRNSLISTDYTVPASKTTGAWVGNAGAGNCGIVFNLQSGQRISIMHNDIQNFYNGIYVASIIPSGRTVLNWGLHNNNLRSCTNAINLPNGGASQYDCLVAVGNLIENCTNMQMPVYNSGNLYLASIWRGGLVEIISSGGALPTYGTWLLGDHIFNGSPIPGGNFGWVCTGPGQANVCTWKTYGAIQA